MADYHLLTIWRIQAPLEAVYVAILDTGRWPEWWPGVKKVELTALGDGNGINSVWRQTWQGKFPYRVVFQVRATCIDACVALEGVAFGDLEGVGRWHFQRHRKGCLVYYDWRVRSTRWWMKLIAPLARAMFIRNHGQLMTQGGQGLARWLNSPLLDQKNINLMAD